MPTIAKARQNFTDLLGRAHYTNERIPVTRRETPFATIVSAKDKVTLDQLDEILREWKFASLEELRERLKEVELGQPKTKRPKK